MHTDKNQASFVRCPKCLAKQKAREDALADFKKEYKEEFLEEEECC
jgi:hypothetical protein